MIKAKNIFYFILLIITVTLLGFFALKDTFLLTLFGDDWLVFWRYNFHLGAPSSGEFNYLTYFLTVYGPEDMSLGIFEPLFHYNSLPYYTISFILRILAALSLYPLVYYLTKSKLTGFIASIFLATTFIGIETTNWVFNMPSYLAIVTFNIFLTIFITRNKLTPKKAFLMALFFYLTFIIQPIRMTGLPLIIFFIALFWFIEKRSLSTIKQILFRLGLLVIAFLCVKYGGQSLGTSTEMIQRVLTGISVIAHALSAGNPSILMHPFIIIGSLFIPDILWNSILPFSGGSLFFQIFLPLFITYIVLVSLIHKAIHKKNHNYLFFIANIALATIWTLLVRFIHKQDLTAFGDPFQLGTSILGGYFFILTISLICKFFGKQQSLLFFLSLIITTFSFLMPWFFGPTGYLTTSHRYLILTGVGVAIFWASITYLFIRSKLIYLFIPVLIAVFYLQIQANHIFFQNLVATRGNNISNNIWSQITQELPNIKKEKYPLVFYFEGDQKNSSTINEVITFGFPPHIALIYDIYHDDNRIPIPVVDYKELQAIVKTGKPLNAYGRKQQPLPVDHIYAFKLEGKEKIVNITERIRKELTLEARISL